MPYWLLRAACRIVPADLRNDWHEHWKSELRSWWILYNRGEVSMGVAAFCRAAVESAIALRLEVLRLSRIVRGPWFVLACAFSLFTLIGVLSDGFSVTQSLIDDAMVGRRGRYFHQNRPFIYSVPIVLALCTAVFLIGIGPRPLRARRWRYWAFLFSKTVAILLIMPLAWIEGGAALRAAIPHFGVRMIGAGVLLAFAFVAGFAATLKWSFDDQRQRCPVCLRRLTLPVTLGSWASVFEPAKTELLCEDGHGALAVSETATGEPDRWTKLDVSL